MALIDDLAQHIHNQGIASIGTTLFKSYLPDSADTAVAVYETGGVKPDIDLPTKSPTFQVLIRASSYSTGKSKLDSVRSAFHNVYNQTIGSTYFYRINAIAEGGHIGRNERGLDEFSINFQALTR